MPGRSKSTRVMPVKTPGTSNQVLDALHRFTEMHHGGRTMAVRSLIVQLEHPAIDTAKSIANPTRFSNTPVSYRLPPPLLGEHSGAILQSLGYSAEDTRTMAADSAT